MHRLLPSLMLCMALQPAWAAGTPARDEVTGGIAPPGIVQVKLAPADAVRSTEQAPIIVAALQDDAAPAPETQPERQTNRGMLLAALTLMAGIVLRRWGVGQQ